MPINFRGLGIPQICDCGQRYQCVRGCLGPRIDPGVHIHVQADTRRLGYYDSFHLHQYPEVLSWQLDTQHMYGCVHLVTSSQIGLAIANARETEISSLGSVSTWRIVSILFLNEATLILTKLSVCMSSGVRLYMLLLINVNEYAYSSCKCRIYSSLKQSFGC